MFSAYSNGYAILRIARDNERANQILTQKTEEIRMLTWPELSNCPASFKTYYNQIATNSITGTNGISGTNFGTLYFGTLAFGFPTNIPSSAAYRTNIHLITISLIWTNMVNNKAVPHAQEMQTLLAQQGMETYVIGTGQ